MEEINWDNYPVGTKFTCEINKISTEGRIQKENKYIYLCQDTHNGSTPRVLLGYDYGWSISIGTLERILKRNVTNLKLELDPEFVINEEIDFNQKGDGYIRINHYKTEINTNPFDNCQNMIIKNFQGLLDASNEELIKIYKYCKKIKPIIIVDLYKSCKSKLLPDNDDLYLFKTPYKNTTGSNMIIAGIKLNKMIEYLENQK